jgi:hypothetical protein
MGEDEIIQMLDLPELRVLDHLNGITNGQRVRAELDAQYCLQSIIEIKKKLNELVDIENARREFIIHILGRLNALDATKPGAPPNKNTPPPNSHTD